MTHLPCSVCGDGGLVYVASTREWDLCPSCVNRSEIEFNLWKEAGGEIKEETKI
jgi:hypothetical protein